MEGRAIICDAGCGEQFIATDFKQADMGNGIGRYISYVRTAVWSMLPSIRTTK